MKSPRSSPARSRLATFVRWVYPVVMICAAASAVAAIARGKHLGWPLATLLVAIVISFVGERIAPVHRAWNKPRRDRGRDLIHAAVNEALAVATVAALPLVGSLLPWPPTWPAHWPFVTQTICAILIADVGITLTHLASHRIPLLWRFHAVHHSVERLYGFNGLMKHPLHQLIETSIGALPLVMMGIPTNVAGALVVCVALQLLMQHSNVDYRIPVLDRLMAWNRVHQLHHVRGPRGDVNFGLFTTVWDRLLGTAVAPDASPLAPREIGLDQRAYPLSWGRQLIEPFRRGRA